MSRRRFSLAIASKPKGLRVPAGDIEGLVLDRLRAFFASRTDVADALAPLDLEARALDAALTRCIALSERWLAMPPIEMRSLVRKIVEQITVVADRIDNPAEPGEDRRGAEAGRKVPDGLISILSSCRSRQSCAAPARGSASSSPMAPSGSQRKPCRMIAEAFAIRNLLLSGSDDSIEAMSGRLGMNKGRLTSLVRLSYLAPGIVRALLAGRQPIELTPTTALAAEQGSAA